MRAQIPENHTASPTCAEDYCKQPGADLKLLQPLWELAEQSDSLLAGSVGAFAADGHEFRIPRFIFLGPKGGGDTVRLGLFATIHGDEINGAEALVGFLQALEQAPGVAKGFHIYAYPVCNPSGFAAGTRNNFAGRDLAREFWRKSCQPEVYYLEREMGVHSFQGVISLHAGRNSSQFLAACRSSLLSAALIQPAIEAARRFIPGAARNSGEGENSILSGFLTVTDELRPVPFEINVSIPGQLPEPSRVHGAIAALKSILNSYRTLMAHGQNL